MESHRSAAVFAVAAVFAACRSAGGSPADSVLDNLRHIADSGRFVYSWTNPWQPTDPAFRAPDGEGWRAKEPDEFTFSCKFRGIADEAPALYFTELNFVVGTYFGEEAYARNRASMTAMVRKAWRDYRAVPVFSWHVENPYAPSGWTDPKYGEKPYRYRYASEGYPQEGKCVIREILEGIGRKCGQGRHSSCGEDEVAAAAAYPNPRAWYEARLKEIASFLDGLKDADGAPIPAVVRLFHECEDDWSWWGRGSVSVTDYVEFFRFTVARLRELTGGGENILFAYSPDRYWWEMGTEGDGQDFSFMGRYPGDDFVDIIGYDDYLIGTGADPQMTEKRFASAVEKMRWITEEARRRGKACGLFESGAIEEALPDYYDWLHRALTADGVGFSFVNLWGGYEIPRTAEGKECFRRFLERPEVVTFRDGVAVSPSVACPGATPTENDVCDAVTIQAGADWIPLHYDPWIEPGSALDFSSVLPRHMPAGKFGRVVVAGDHFEFEGLPGVPQRLYGVNLCNTANLPSSREAADRFAANLARIGYNAVRIHHHERDLIAEGGKWRDGQDDTVPTPGQMEKLDWLVAACVEHGLYLTTDLYVSRSYATPWRSLGIDRDGRMANGVSFKILCAFWEPAYSNLCAWAKNFLSHVNPCTGRSLAEEPALVALSLVNEGNLGNWGGEALRKTPGVDAAWQAWIAERRKDEAFAGIPDTIPDDLYAADGSTPERRHSAAFAIFLAERETMLFERLKAFVRGECGCRAPLSSLSAWYNPVQYQLPRTHFDYVDEHFYVDHPKWLERPWNLPSSCPNRNPVAGRDAGGRDVEWRRLVDKPFCLTEWNFSAPGRFRGVGGIATGALGALQGWDGMWRFAWSHNRDGIEKPGGRIGFFDVNADPLAMAAERAALCVFLRRDLAELETGASQVLDAETLGNPENGAPRFPGPKQSLARGWTRKVGSKVLSHAEASARAETKPPPDAPADSVPTGVSIDPVTGTFLLDTPCTAGGFAESGTHEAGPMRFTLVGGKDSRRAAESAEKDLDLSFVDIGEQFEFVNNSPATPATVWASSLDGRPLPVASRILVTHLTDVQNSGTRYGDAARTILQSWGGLPHLARNGGAEIELDLAGGTKPKIFRLDTAGRRIAEIPATFDSATGHLRFTARTDFDPASATLCYELVREFAP